MIRQKSIGHFILSPMDILSNVLDLAGIEKSLLVERSFYLPWALKFPCNKSIGFHVVTQGQLYIRSAQLAQPIVLQKGDILLATIAWEHEVATDADVPVQSTMPVEDLAQSKHAGAALVTFASGVYRFDDAPSHVFFKELPDRILIRAQDIPSHDPMHSALLLLSAELATKQLGKNTVTRSLLDIMFHYMLRLWAKSNQHHGETFSAALNDPYIYKALKVMHDAPEKEWSIQKLAEVSGLSRAAFAQKFKQMIGDTPAHYLSDLRIKKAAKIFRTTSYNVEEAAQAVGYQDSFVFSKAFKRVQGLSPSSYRKNLQASAKTG